MKEFAISVFVILILSCIFNSIGMWMGVLPEMPPYPYGSTITDVKTSAPSFGCKRDDFCYPEMNLTNGKRATNFITDITENGDRSSAEFPLGANN